jgi:SAM-dependent methyltransferase
VVQALTLAGWEAIGTEPSPALAEMGRERGLRIEGMTAEAFLESWRAAGDPPFGGITLMNVLEHVADPGGMVEDLIPALAPAGRLIVRVPNDFNPLQDAARAALGGEPWWIAVPDHVNYFDHESIARLLERIGLEVVDRLTDFPMELFLLMGHDYRNDPAVGREVHDERRRAELALDAPTRRRLGRAWVAAGVGRNAFVVAQRKA